MHNIVSINLMLFGVLKRQRVYFLKLARINCLEVRNYLVCYIFILDKSNIPWITIIIINTTNIPSSNFFTLISVENNCYCGSITVYPITDVFNYNLHNSGCTINLMQSYLLCVLCVPSILFCSSYLKKKEYEIKNNNEKI